MVRDCVRMLFRSSIWSLPTYDVRAFCAHPHAVRVAASM